MNVRTIFCSILILHSMDAFTAERNRNSPHRNPPSVESFSEEESEEIQRKSLCDPIVIKEILEQTNITFEIIQNDLNRFGRSQRNMNFKLRNVDNSLFNIQETNSEIKSNLDSQEELLEYLNNSITNAAKRCRNVENSLEGRLLEVLKIATNNNNTLDILRKDQVDLSNDFKSFKHSTEASLLALTALITDKVIKKLDNLERSSIKIEANQEFIKIELIVLDRLKNLTENIIENTIIIQGQITNLNESTRVRLSQLKEELKKLIISNSQCSGQNQYQQLLTQLEIIESKLNTCQSSENLLKTGIDQINKNDAVLTIQIENLRDLTSQGINQILENQRNRGCDSSYPLEVIHTY